MRIQREDLLHYGILRRSGRYPWGSGEDTVTRSRDFMDHIRDLKANGLSETEIARGLEMTTTQLRNTRTIALNAVKQHEINEVQRYVDKGMSNTAIGLKMGKNESSIRALRAEGAKTKASVLGSIAERLREAVDEKTYIDVGTGVENHLGISADQLRAAVSILKDEGYEVHTVKKPQLGTGLDTTFKVLAPKGTTQKDVFLNSEKIRLINDKTIDRGRTWLGIHTPLPISVDRVGIVYGEKGAQKDGVIYVRPGVPDVSLGGSSYAQVRIQVGKGHYLKGMAMYNNNLPDGVDLQFHTNKKDTGNKTDAMKPLQKIPGTDKVDTDNPFGSVLKAGGQQLSTSRGKTKVTSVMNIINEEGDWGKWSDSIASQVLSKQSPTLAKQQLGKAFSAKKQELDEIMALTNPVVRKKLLDDFAASADSAAVHLKAAALPKQRTHIILPITSMKEGEVYAPNYKNGESVVLIRYPHAGQFEIPELRVNNAQREAKSLLGQAKDAIGIHPKVAERLSGADFDGDFVLVIPNDSKKIKSLPALEALKKFDPKTAYPKYEGMPKMTAQQKGREMGDVSNLITDMTIKKASLDEIARAVKHSMVVIDAEKHDLDYKQSAIDNGIPALKKKYQANSKSGRGSSTLISRAKSEERVPERKLRLAPDGGPIDRETGARVYVPTGATRRAADGTRVPKMQRSTKLAETSDAHTLSSGTRIEEIYADHSNSMKALGNKARLLSLDTPPLKYSPSAAKVHAAEVKTLNAKLDLAQRNAPLERQAQVLANEVYKDKKQAHPEMDKATQKKVKSQALQEARRRTDAKKDIIEITDSEWQAIQAGAISSYKLTQILRNANPERVKELATPRTSKLMNSDNQRRATTMLEGGATRAEVAAALGVSLSTLDKGLNE